MNNVISALILIFLAILVIYLSTLLMWHMYHFKDDYKIKFTQFVDAYNANPSRYKLHRFKVWIYDDSYKVVQNTLYFSYIDTYFHYRSWYHKTLKYNDPILQKNHDTDILIAKDLNNT